MSHYADFLILTISLVGLSFGAGEWIGRTGVEPVVKRVETCSPRSIDNYSPTELRRIAGARERMGRVKP